MTNFQAFLLFIGLLLAVPIVISFFPAHNPLRRLLGIIVTRLGWTAAVVAIDIPATLGIPIGGEIIDLASFIGLVVYWGYGIKKAMAELSPPPTWHDIDRIDRR